MMAVHSVLYSVLCLQCVVYDGCARCVVCVVSTVCCI